MKLWGKINTHAEIKYKHYTYKSKLEVYWACWLEMVRVRFLYEPMKVPLPTFGLHNYRIPDFLITVGSEQWILEIKPELKPNLKPKLLGKTTIADELLKMLEVAQQTQTPTLVGFNWPGIDTVGNTAKTRGKNRSDLMLILPNSNTTLFNSVETDMSKYIANKYTMSTPYGRINTTHFRHKQKEVWWFPYFGVALYPKVYFRVHKRGIPLTVTTTKPDQLNETEFRIQQYIRTKFKF